MNKTICKGLALVSLLGCAAVAFAGESAAASHIKGVTAITEVFGDGQKVSAVALEYDGAIDGSKLKLSDFSVEGKTVTRVYANVAAAKTTRTINGPFVIVEVDTKIAADSGMPAGPTANASGQGANPGAGAGGPPPGFEGPKLGEKSDKPATAKELSASVIQKGDIVTANGQIYKAVSASLPSTKTIDLMIGDFKQLVYKDPAYNGEALMYNLYVPKNYDANRKYPLVLFMHDAGVVSNNPEETLTQGLGSVIWATPEEQAKHECFVLAPQYDCVITDDTSETAIQMDMTVDLLKGLMKQYSIDANRLYNTGQSMGGMTSIAMDIKYPDLFAASLLVACQWDATKVAPMANKPLWIIVSEGDNKANPGQDAITENLKKLGATVSKATWSAESTPEQFDTLVSDMLAKNCSINYTVFKGGSHRYTWQYAYGISGVRDWLLSQVKTTGLSAQEIFAQGDALSQTGDQFGAAQYFLRAAAMGNTRANEMLGTMYAEGRGVAQDYAKAIRFDQAAIDQGSARSYTDLGLLYMNGRGVPKDYAKALDLFDKAATAGDFKAPRWSGIIYLKGEGGIPADISKAASLFSLAAGKGDITANYYLGYMYENGPTFAKNYLKAAEYYQKAAPTTGHAEGIACTALGRLYENGLGVAKDTAKSLAWYQRGASLGDPAALAALDRLKSN